MWPASVLKKKTAKEKKEKEQLQLKAKMMLWRNQSMLK